MDRERGLGERWDVHGDAAAAEAAGESVAPVRIALVVEPA
jgi:hypothetical protein